MEWVDQEWPQSLKMCLAKLWRIYEKILEVGLEEVLSALKNI